MAILTVRRASSQFHPHADCAPVETVRHHAHLAGEYRRVQVVAHDRRGIIVARQNLKQRKHKILAQLARLKMNSRIWLILKFKVASQVARTIKTKIRFLSLLRDLQVRKI